MLSEYPLMKSFIVDKETPSYFLFFAWGYPPLPPDPFVEIYPQKQMICYRKRGQDCCS
jgi:hypothetical protein